MADEFVPPRIKNDPAVKAWLKTQSEFKLSDFAQYKQSSSHVTGNAMSLDRADVAEAIRSVLHLVSPRDREYLTLSLEMLPREVARKLGVPRDNMFYKRLQAAKMRALALYMRPPKPPPRKVLQMPPAPLKTLRFTTPAFPVPRTARLVLRESLAVWIDDENGIFPGEIQDLLSELKELAPGFEIVDVEG